MYEISEFFRTVDFEGCIWLTTLVVGLILTSYGILYWFLQKKKREINYLKAAIFEFLACWVMYIPEEYFNELCDNTNVALRIIESITTALLKSFNVYGGDGYVRVTYISHIYFSSIYGIVRVVANIVMILLIGGFIMNFLNGPMQKIKLHFCRKRKTYVFSDWNDKTMAISQSIAWSANLPKKKNIIFACAGENILRVDKEKADSIGAIFINETIEYIVQHVEKATEMEIFLFEDDEESNLVQLEEICSKLKKYNGLQVKLYVELLKTPWNLYDELSYKYQFKEDAKIIVNFIRTEENFIYNHLLEHSIFDRFIEEDSEKRINLLIVGEMKDRNLELLKAILHLGQMPGYKLTVYVIEDKCERDKLYQRMPEVKDNCNIVGDAIYSLHFWENIDYDSNEFDKIICNEIPNFTFAFVNVGDDLKNVNLAMRINAYCHRSKRSLDCYTIQANVSQQKICDKWNQSLLEGIKIVGDFEKTYNYEFITMSKIEKATIKIHDTRYKGTKSWIEYCNNEYNRHSVYARTLSFKYKVWLIDQLYKSDESSDVYEKYKVTGKNILDMDGNETNEWKIYEHMRWNMYTRTLGYCLANKNLLNSNGVLDKNVRNLALVHSDLVTFDNLPKKEQQKDALELTPEIVDILKSI